MPKTTDIRPKIGIASIGDGYIARQDGSKIILFRIDPYNLEVLSEENIESKIIALKMLMQTLGQYQIIATDDRENYSENRNFLRRRAAEETVPAIREILEKDEQSIKEIEAKTNAARTFLIAVNVPPKKEKEYEAKLKSFYSLAQQSVLHVSRITKDEIKKLLAVYFHQDTTTEEDAFADLDGEQYYQDVDWAKLEDEIRHPVPAATASTNVTVSASHKGGSQPWHDPSLKRQSAYQAPAPTPAPELKPADDAKAEQLKALMKDPEYYDLLSQMFEDNQKGGNE